MGACPGSVSRLRAVHTVANPNDKSWEGLRVLGFRPRSEADQQAWRKAGSPTQWNITTDSVAGSQRLTMEPGKGELHPINAATSYLPDLGGFDLAQVQQLPTDRQNYARCSLRGSPLTPTGSRRTQLSPTCDCSER